MLLSDDCMCIKWWFDHGLNHGSLLTKAALRPSIQSLFYCCYKNKLKTEHHPSKKCFVCASTNISANVSLVLRHGQAFSPIYRFSLSDGTIVSAHTKSKLVRSPATNEPQLYMSLHILQRYVLLPAPVSGRERQICSLNLVTCFSLLMPCSTTCCIPPCILYKWVNM